MSPLQSYKVKEGKFDDAKFFKWMVDWIEKAPHTWREKTFKALNRCKFAFFTVTYLNFFCSEIFPDDDNDDEEPSSDSNLILMHQHMVEYVSN